METTDESGFVFPEISKAEWLEQVNRDLKGKSPEDLTFVLDADLAQTPFVHRDDAAPAAPLAATSDWEICEDISVDADPVTSRRSALDALEGGAESLCFQWNKAPDAETFKTVFEGIYPDFIGLHFEGPGCVENPGNIFVRLGALAQSLQIPASSLRGSLSFDPAAAAGKGIVDWRYLADLLEYGAAEFPGFHMVTLRQHPASGTVMEPLADLLKRAENYFRSLAQRGRSYGEIAGTIQFEITIGTRYFVEIARLRALKLLWLNLLKAHNLPLQYPRIAVRFDPAAYTDELYTNMLRGVSMAMSAVIGGADRVTVLPYDAGRENQSAYPPQFSRRIARNAQHLLKMEAHLPEYPDAGAGSYYVEALTRQIAEKTWKRFTESLSA